MYRTLLKFEFLRDTIGISDSKTFFGVTMKTRTALFWFLVKNDELTVL